MGVAHCRGQGDSFVTKASSGEALVLRPSMLICPMGDGIPTCGVIWLRSGASPHQRMFWGCVLVVPVTGHEGGVAGIASGQRSGLLLMPLMPARGGHVHILATNDLEPLPCR